MFESLNHKFTGELFYWRDFYIADSQSDLIITLDQKFMDPATYLPLVEILAATGWAFYICICEAGIIRVRVW